MRHLSNLFNITKELGLVRPTCFMYYHDYFNIINYFHRKQIPHQCNSGSFQDDQQLISHWSQYLKFSNNCWDNLTALYNILLLLFKMFLFFFYICIVPFNIRKSIYKLFYQIFIIFCSSHTYMYLMCGCSFIICNTFKKCDWRLFTVWILSLLYFNIFNKHELCLTINSFTYM